MRNSKKLKTRVMLKRVFNQIEDLDFEGYKTAMPIKTDVLRGEAEKMKIAECEENQIQLYNDAVEHIKMEVEDIEEVNHSVYL